MDAEKRLAEMNSQDDEYLEHLKDSTLMQDSFGISRLQRMMRIGYNRSANLVDRAIESGILIRDSKREWLVKFNQRG